ncbi:putative sensor histidine kinase NarS [Mycobacterium attenuatum]|uniref:Putative sensor histidine kinase NarS n=1 Tax=Mycobacterium attenuatum TaxID=2341086 RepID=A0A498QAR5_9MYCO|nr:putative sensor histidine kinase NarS [Mycobacterium attenuatum]VBA58769.1 putative sensor histidine kinase NarS [Mycobacterium attenuatum]VBA61433.1 putative sensor histidine kinase NarS [Mycobacterium attenuatum]
MLTSHPDVVALVCSSAAQPARRVNDVSGGGGRAHSGLRARPAKLLGGRRVAEQAGTRRREYGIPVAISSDVELERVRKLHQLRSYRIVSVLRIGVLVFLIAAMIVGTPAHEWAQQTVLVAFYGLAAVCALALAFSPVRRRIGAGESAGVRRWEPLTFTAIDIVALTGFQLLSAHGLYPLLIMTLLPVLAGVDISSLRTMAVLAFSLLGFVLAGVHDGVLLGPSGWPHTGFLFSLYAFLCATALVVVRIEERHVRSVAGLSALREELLAQTMTASEVLQRRISESIHDGPLQDVLAARQELVELQTAWPGDERVDRALAGLQDASERLRQATFELHPAVLEQVGLGAAVEQLAASTAARSGINVSIDIDYPVRNEIDPIVFGVARELLSNVVRHSRAHNASVSLGITDGVCVLDVADDGVGISGDIMARRLGEGHIGLASHRARVDAAGGTFVFLDTRAGTHVCVELPLKSDS